MDVWPVIPVMTGHEGYGDLTITLEDNGETLLTGPVVDQAACTDC